MKTYVVFYQGEEKGMMKAASHNDAEKKARKKFGCHLPKCGRCAICLAVSVAYTEV